MKATTLFFAMSVSLVSFPTFADELRELGNKITHTDRSEPGENHHVRDGIRGAAEDARDGVRSGWRKRPRASSYISLEKVNGGKIAVVYCDAGIKRFFERKGCKRLHDKPFKPAELKSCLAGTKENSNPGERINRHLDKLLDSDMSYRNFHLLDVRKNYSRYLRSCETKLDQRMPARAPVNKPSRSGAKPKEEFKPFVPPTQEDGAASFDIPQEQGGSL